VPLAFQIDDTSKKTAKHVRELLETEVKRYPALFGVNSRDIRFRIDDESIYYVVLTLQNYRLLSNEEDAVAEAFQVIRGKAYKGEEGQYFTPLSVVRVAVAAIDPKPENRVIDPGCGSGTFLATVLRSVVESFERRYRGNKDQVDAERTRWSNNNLFAIDKDSVSVRLSKAYLSMLGDGSTHVFKADAIRPSHWAPIVQASIRDESFDVVVTNPPFGKKLKVTADIGREERYELARAWEMVEGEWQPTGDYVKRHLGLIFLERSIRLLNEGGRLAIVLPDTYLFSPSYGWLVHWLRQFTITHSINVPIEAFEPHCRAKTSVLVLKKQKPTKTHQIIGSLCETFGEDKIGRPRFKLVDGVPSDQRDDEMGEAAQLFSSPARPEESKLYFRFSQAEAIERGVLVASYWWRKPYAEAVEAFAKENRCDLVPIGDMIDSGEIEVTAGHGSPQSHFKGRGAVPYVKVVDIKNWRMIENPKYFIPEAAAARLRRSRPLHAYDLISPTRTTRNIGLFAVVMPWQTQAVLTREIAIWRVNPTAKRIDPWLLLALTSLKVVHDQFNYLVLMQMNREDLGERYREVLLPVPKEKALRDRWSQPIAAYFKALAAARESYDVLEKSLDPRLFADKP
jgi:type I restriction enzyme M protein